MKEFCLLKKTNRPEASLSLFTPIRVESRSNDDGLWHSSRGWRPFEPSLSLFLYAAVYYGGVTICMQEVLPMENSRTPKIQLEFSHFADLFMYALRHADPDDLMYQRLYAETQKKLDAKKRHILYSQYKSGKSEEERRKARLDYLDLIELLPDFQWPEEYDVNVTHSDKFLHED